MPRALDPEAVTRARERDEVKDSTLLAQRRRRRRRAATLAGPDRAASPGCTGPSGGIARPPVASPGDPEHRDPAGSRNRPAPGLRPQRGAARRRLARPSHPGNGQRRRMEPSGQLRAAARPTDPRCVQHPEGPDRDRCHLDRRGRTSRRLFAAQPRAGPAASRPASRRGRVEHHGRRPRTRAVQAQIPLADANEPARLGRGSSLRSRRHGLPRRPRHRKAQEQQNCRQPQGPLPAAGHPPMLSWLRCDDTKDMALDRSAGLRARASCGR